MKSEQVICHIGNCLVGMNIGDCEEVSKLLLVQEPDGTVNTVILTPRRKYP